MRLFRAALLYYCVFLLGTTAVCAQQKEDTTKPGIPLKVTSFDDDDLHYGNSTFHDSVTYKLDSFHIVHPFLINTGNLGSPGHALLFPRIDQHDAFAVRPDAFAYFGFNRFNRRFYNTNQPYTLLQYFVGQKQEQYVNVLHARNFGDNLNFSFHFIRARSEGFYRRQQTSNTSLRTNLWYMGPAKHYAFMTDVFWTGANVAENGGLADDSTFTDADQLDRQVNEIKLDAAGTIERKRGVWMKHTFSLGKVTDTLVLDSAHSYNVITPAWGISLVSELYDEKYTYTDADPLSGFYSNIFRDSVSTVDSTYCWRINNSLRLEKFNQRGSKSNRGYLGVRHESGEYFNDTIYKNFQNVYAEGRYVYSDSTTDLMTVAGWYALTGTNSGDFRFELTGRSVFEEINLDIVVHGITSGLSPAMLFTNYSGNHLRWTNAFEQVRSSVSELLISERGRNLTVQASARILSEQNVLYFDNDFVPQQYEGTINTSSYAIAVTWRAGWFNSATRFTYSHSSNSLVRLPEMLVQHSMFADLKLFKNALHMQVGTDILWFSEFTAEAYMPAVGQFYIQNTRRAGDYAYISPWLSFRIKPVRVFVKVDHANAGLMGRKYFLMDHYPANDLAVKIGLSWLFSD